MFKPQPEFERAHWEGPIARRASLCARRVYDAVVYAFAVEETRDPGYDIGSEFSYRWDLYDYEGDFFVAVHWKGFSHGVHTRIGPGVTLPETPEQIDEIASSIYDVLKRRVADV